MLGASGLGAPACWEWAALTKPAETAPRGCGQMSMGCRGGTAYPACWQMPWQSWGSSAVAPQTCCSFSPGTLKDTQEVLGVNKGAWWGVQFSGYWAAKARCAIGLQGRDLEAMVSSV